MKDVYPFQEIEEKWQKIWAQEKVFAAGDDPRQTKYYCLEMYPYPSGRIHMGHVRNYSIGDVISRFKLMKGFNVLHPIGWDALGMPAENAAIKHGIHPQEWTLDNIAHMKRQLQRLGFSYDWSREVNTCLPEYYRWNQWIFLKMFDRGLAFRKKSWVNWCPQCRTVLANEQAAGGVCWRCDSGVEQKEMDHWFLRITAYAKELLEGHRLLEKWPEHVLLMQRNWIGESEGAHIFFALKGDPRTIEVFTTRIDTIFGATFMLLSPEHPLSRELLAGSPDKERRRQEMVRAVRDARMRKEEGEAEKEGIDTGKKAINPFSGEEIPIWIANYVLMDYGTGAVMAVPAHDQRDFEFARKYDLLVRTVIVPAEKPGFEEPLEGASEEYGRLINSGAFSGLSSREAMEQMSGHARERGFGRKSLTYRLRDWGISRQRYWGTPIPIIYCEKCGTVGVPYEDLPVELPFAVKFTGGEGSPLERASGFVDTTCPKCGGKARRETDTMDTFFDSSWYFFRYLSPHKQDGPFDPAGASYWLPVDLYIGGVEHAILHLIYARFFTKVLRDLGISSVDEPFPHYLAQGMVTKDGAAMSKSRGNVVDPDEIVQEYGADSLRLFMLFASPPEKEFAWAEDGIEGAFRFLNRVWAIIEENRDLFGSEATSPQSLERAEGMTLLRKTHRTIRKVTEDIEKRCHLNTAISSVMELYNLARKEKEALRQSDAGRGVLRLALESLIILLSPFTPHLSEELWERTGHRGLLARYPWPDFDPDLAREEKVTIVVQVNGRLRDKFEADPDIGENEMKERALALDRIRAAIAGRTIRKVICIENKLVNIVV
ncbi:MAG TPA: leucine--tRNA ligase [Candidatus Desulfaltia sp.]|nr:leucine--tRNA ligase [Candidatus Desulfaltia sp.]